MNERILQAFLASPGEYVSGEQLSGMLHCSRTTVWKHVRSLKQAGYEFEAVPRKGYRLTGRPDRLDDSFISANLRTKTLGRTLHIFDKTDSTQIEASRLAAGNAAEGTVVIAEEQTAGKGRMGRSWHSPRGKGIWMSVILKPDIALLFVPQFTLLIAVAVNKAIYNTCGVDIGIKWPNDLLFEGKKVCGILLESSAEDERLRYVVAGIGIDVNLSEDDYPPELADKAGSLRMACGAKIDRTALICSVLEQVEYLYQLYLEKGFEPIRLLWIAHSVTLQKQVSVQTPAGGRAEGMAETIDEYGALVIKRKNGERYSLFSGEVNFAIMEK